MTNLEKLKEIFPNAEPYHCPKYICGEMNCFVDGNRYFERTNNICQICVESYWNSEYENNGFSYPKRMEKK